MLQKNKGYFLTELLLSLTAWLIIAGVIFPLIMKVMNNIISAEQEYVAEKLLYEGLIVAKKNGFFPVQETISTHQTNYEITHELLVGEAVLEVCIQYVDVYQRANKKCEFFK